MDFYHEVGDEELYELCSEKLGDLDRISGAYRIGGRSPREAGRGALVERLKQQLQVVRVEESEGDRPNLK